MPGRAFALDEKNRRHISSQAAEKRKEVEQLEARLTQAEDQRDNFRRKEKATVRAFGNQAIFPSRFALDRALCL
eukprot:COSAG05_NODE_1939_length_3797_cov_24.989471_3_plen_74_part_00